MPSGEQTDKLAAYMAKQARQAVEGSKSAAAYVCLRYGLALDEVDALPIGDFKALYTAAKRDDTERALTQLYAAAAARDEKSFARYEKHLKKTLRNLN